MVRLSVIGPAREVLEKLSAIPEIGKITVTGTAGEATDFKIEPERNGDICPDISKEMLAGGWAITQLYSDTLSLEDIFLKMINEPPESLLKAFDKGDRKAKAGRGRRRCSRRYIRATPTTQTTKAQTKRRATDNERDI